jgi:hypothetical protein
MDGACINKIIEKEKKTSLPVFSIEADILMSQQVYTKKREVIFIRRSTKQRHW